MPRPRILPDRTTLRRWVNEGKTQNEMVEIVRAETGEQISRSAISVALHRAGLTTHNPRYKDEIPWKVGQAHLAAYPVRMLRLLGRRRAGGDLSDDDTQRLDSWLAVLEDWEAVVAYSPTVGFMYVDGDEVGDFPDGIPIRPRTITDSELPESVIRLAARD